MFRGDFSLYDFQTETLGYLLSSEHAKEDEMLPNEGWRHVLTEPYGSGKTFIILALIMRNPIPPPQRMPIVHAINGQRAPASIMPTLPNQIIRPTAIIVARSVFAQWMTNIRERTTLRAFEVPNMLKYEKLCTAILNGDINDFDIVLIKNGIKNAEKLDAITLINRRSFPRFWSRVVYDDVDVIHKCKLLRSTSALFVSAAIDFHLPRRQIYQSSESIREFLCNLPSVENVYRARTSCIWRQYGHSATDIAKHHNDYAIRWMSVRIANSKLCAISAAIDNTVIDCAQIGEMLKSDAVSSAATALGVKMVSPEMILATVLGKQRDFYEVARARIELIEKTRAKKREAEETERDFMKRCGVTEKLLTLARREIPCLTGMDSEDALRQFIAACEKSYAHIRDNLRLEKCCICYTDFAEVTDDRKLVIIKKCCGFIICSQCAGQCLSIQPDGGAIIGYCPQCRTKLNIANDVLIIDSRVSAKLTSLVDSQIVHVESTSTSVKRDAVIVTSKSKYISAIIRGAEITGENVRMTVIPTPPLGSGDVLVGSRMVMPQKRKFLVCADYDETIHDIARELNEDGIRFTKLLGSVAEFASIIWQFAHDDTSILIINTGRLYSGIDLQFVTDLILITEYGANRLGQIVGRAQRIGRTNSLTVHALQYCHSL